MEEVGVFRDVTRIVIHLGGGAYVEVISDEKTVFEDEAWGVEMKWKKGLIKRMKVGIIEKIEPPETVLIYDFVDPAVVRISEWYDLEHEKHFTLYVAG